MINKPALHDLMEKCDSKYELVIVAAKRARSIIDQDPDMVIASRANPVSMALRDVSEDRVHWEHRSNENKQPADTNS